MGAPEPILTSGAIAMTQTHLVFLGPPGAGKGTHAKFLANEHGLLHLSTGDMLRMAIQEAADYPEVAGAAAEGAVPAHVAIGMQARAFMDAGNLVPDDLIIEMIFHRLASATDERGWILDGFPRTVPQAQALDSRLEHEGGRLDHVLLFEVPETELIARLGSRATCASCGAIYNTRIRPPTHEGVCDVCGGVVRQRRDDRPDAVRKRLQVYHELTAPLVEYYEAGGRLRRVDANRTIQRIRVEIETLLGLQS